MIASTLTAQTVASKLSGILDEPLVELASDGTVEGDIDNDTSSSDRVIIVASTTTSSAHMDLLELQELASKRDPDKIITVLSYMGYARQDKAFKYGAPISARAVAQPIGTGTDQVYVVNPHNVSVLDYFGVPAEPIDAAPKLAKAIPNDLTDPLFLGPDEDATWIARSVRDSYGSGEVDNFDKLRHSATSVEMTTSETEFTGQDVILADDMIATGGTMSEAISILDEQDVGRLFVTCVHPVLAGKAVSKLYRAGVDNICATDSIDKSVSKVSAAGPIAEKF